MNCVITILLKLALTLVKDVFCNANCVKCKKVYDGMLRFSQVTHQSKKEGKDQESIQSSTTPDPVYQWESNKLTIRHHKREQRGQPFPSRLPQGNNKQTRTKA